MSLSVSALRCTLAWNAVQNTMWVGSRQIEKNMRQCNKHNRPALHNDRTCLSTSTESATQVRHAKLQARFSGNDTSGKELQLGHVYVLAAVDARTAEARGIDLQQADRAVPSGKWVLNPAPPKFQVNKVVSSAPSESTCRQGCPSYQLSECAVSRCSVGSCLLGSGGLTKPP